MKFFQNEYSKYFLKKNQLKALKKIVTTSHKEKKQHSKLLQLKSIPAGIYLLYMLYKK